MIRRLLVATLLSASFSLTARASGAQQMDLPIRKGQLVTFDLGSRDRCDTSEYDCPRRYVRAYVYRVSKGETFMVSVSGPTGAWRAVTSTGATLDDLGPCVSVLAQDRVATCHLTEPSRFDYELAIVIGNDHPGGEFHVGLYEAGATGEHARTVAERERGQSSISGLNVAAAFGSRMMSVRDMDQPHSSEGYLLRAGLGFLDRIEIFGEYQDEIADERIEGQSGADGWYSVRSQSVGTRLFLTGGRSRFRPYLEGSYGLRERELADGDALVKGRTFGGGLGFSVFLARPFAFDFAVVAGRSAFERAELDGETLYLNDGQLDETSVGVRVGASFNLIGSN